MTQNTRITIKTPIIVALDFDNESAAMSLVDSIDPSLCRLKVGKEMFTRFGPQFVSRLQQKGFEIFLDLKFHDIPHTVAKAVLSAADLGVWMTNVHTLGGPAMLEAASDALKKQKAETLLIGVTLLTSMEQNQLTAVGLQATVQEQVVALAQLAKQQELDGVVCSAQEASLLEAKIPSPFLKVTPGIRPAGADTHDQSRIMTPQKALEAGADYLVIGRPITQQTNPQAALEAIIAEIN
ncbi:MAG: orotidine-5'-phosphate decarboxylase [Pseudomonadota bacterium]